ncbi:hypothetical protein, partial [Streptomyces milbemycinicus]|uniref:hypothetical protein n=1 Tax=Streptomyces milbemycinicus TaxID=476552 RepID=UPI003407756C
APPPAGHPGHAADLASPSGALEVAPSAGQARSATVAPEETVALIQRLARENPTWGYVRIHCL